MSVPPISEPVYNNPGLSDGFTASVPFRCVLCYTAPTHGEDLNP